MEKDKKYLFYKTRTIQFAAVLLPIIMSAVLVAMFMSEDYGGRNILSSKTLTIMLLIDVIVSFVIGLLFVAAINITRKYYRTLMHRLGLTDEQIDEAIKKI